MRDYEVVYIFDAALEEPQVTEKLERFHGLLTAPGGTATEGAQISAVDHWGRRQFAYPIEKRENGYYVVAQFTAAATALPEFERQLGLDNDVVRYLVVINEGELATTPAGPRPPQIDDEDGDEGPVGPGRDSEDR